MGSRGCTERHKLAGLITATWRCSKEGAKGVPVRAKCWRAQKVWGSTGPWKERCWSGLGAEIGGVDKIQRECRTMDVRAQRGSKEGAQLVRAKCWCVWRERWRKVMASIWPGGMDQIQRVTSGAYQVGAPMGREFKDHSNDRSHPQALRQLLFNIVI